MKKGFTHESTYNESKEWYTPRPIFDALGLTFDLDPCSPGKDIVPWIPAKRHLTYLDDGLNAHWEGRVWMNPPYGMDTPKWFKHLSMVGNGIALVFARTDTRWFHNYVPLADAICFINGRVHFIPAEKDGVDYPRLYAAGNYVPKSGCGAASMLVAFGKDNAKALYSCGLGLALPVIKLAEMFRTGERFGDDKLHANPTSAATARSYENPPRNAESGQGHLFRRPD